MSMTAEETGAKEPKAEVEGSDSWEVVPEGAFQLVRIKIGGHKGKIGYYGADLPQKQLNGRLRTREEAALAMVEICFDGGAQYRRIPRSNLEAYGPILPVHRLLASLLDVWDGDEANALGDWCLERGLEVLGEQLNVSATTLKDGKCQPTKVAHDCLQRLALAFCFQNLDDEQDFRSWEQRWLEKHFPSKEVYGGTDSVIRANGLGGVTFGVRTIHAQPGNPYTTVSLPADAQTGDRLRVDVPQGSIVQTTAGPLTLSGGLHELVFDGERWRVVATTGSFGGGGVGGNGGGIGGNGSPPPMGVGDPNLTAALIAARNGFMSLPSRPVVRLVVGNNVVVQRDADLYMPDQAELGSVVDVTIRSIGVAFEELGYPDGFAPQHPGAGRDRRIRLRRVNVGDHRRWLVMHQGPT